MMVHFGFIFMYLGTTESSAPALRLRVSTAATLSSSRRANRGMSLNFQVCPCCVPSIAIGLASAGFVIVATARVILGDSRGLASRVLKWLSYALGAVVFVAAVGLTALASNATLRSRAFAKLCASMAKEPAMLPPRCEKLGLGSALAGKAVIEFGPGPGTNFACSAQGVNEPSRWVGVEPNAFFAEAQAAAAANSSFPRETKWLKGETVDVEAGSFDAAVLTHVLCSVDDPAEVVRQAARALKSGGQLLVMEHVAAPEGTPMRAVQKIFAPVFEIVGNGCQFRHTGKILEDLARESGLFAGLEIEPFEAPVPIPFLKPHIIAKASRAV